MEPVDRMTTALRLRGLDLVHPFAVEAGLDALFPFPRFGRESCLGLLIGNSRALWAPFSAWVSASGAGREDPLDDYVAEAVGEVLTGARAEVFFTQRRDYVAGSGVAAVPFQRLGREIGFAALGPAHLSVHPVYGPWFAFRAVVVLDAPAPAELALASPRLKPCGSCSQPCVGAVEEALRASGTGDASRPVRADIREHWRRWVAVRDSCPHGGAHRYGEAQIGYHYTKDRAHLG
jgi:methylmalonic aciduria homocystinuria type C protein